MNVGPVGLDRIETFAAGLDHPEGIAITPEGRIYVGGEAPVRPIGSNQTTRSPRWRTPADSSR